MAVIDITAIGDWLTSHSGLLWTVSMVSIGTFVVTLAVIPYFIVRIPEDYLIRRRKHQEKPFAQKPWMRAIYLVLKNLLGIILFVVGLFMFVIPGQGIITMLIGIMLMNFPGKRRIATAIVRQPAIFKSINWTRAKALTPPLLLPPEQSR